jgi:hypothetical protein
VHSEARPALARNGDANDVPPINASFTGIPPRAQDCAQHPAGICLMQVKELVVEPRLGSKAGESKSPSGSSFSHGLHYSRKIHVAEAGCHRPIEQISRHTGGAQQNPGPLTLGDRVCQVFAHQREAEVDGIVG